ncbi:TAXI family TRAP transporter solute-binding subunit [Acidaminococcus sp.]|uniref:TAXI family TRAP transporter solute-binding subunit n=1 Tax=Acidaminococcus sp. TaxID=1872103 RepID=UPI003D7D9964
MKKLLLLVLALLFLCMAGCGGQGKEQTRGNKLSKELVLAGGQNNGAYGSLGTDLAALLNGDGKQPQLKETGGSGSVANVELLAQGRADLAFIQSDVAYAAIIGTDRYAGQAKENLQVLGVLYPETVQIVTYDVTGIRKLEDLRGRTLAVGAAGSGSAYDARQILEAAGIPEDEVRIQYLPVEDEVKALKEGTVDAVFVTSELPYQAFKELARQRQLMLIPIEGQAADDLLEAYPRYRKTVIPAGTYPNQTKPCNSVGMDCLLVATDRLDADYARSFLGRVWSHWGELHSKYPFLPADPKQSFFKGLDLPLAPGAEQFKKDQKVSS